MVGVLNWLKVLVAILFFLIAYVSLPLTKFIPGYLDYFKEAPEIFWWIENAARPLAPVLVGLALVYGIKPGRWARELGFDRPMISALILAFVITSPLLVAPIVMGAPLSTDSWVKHLFSAGIWPLEEETVFRGYGFGQIYLYSGLGFWPAGILTSLLFGVAHMANAAASGLDLSGQLANAGVVGLSALALAWFYARWNRNIWLVFFVHGFGNLWGNVFQLGDTAVQNPVFLGLLVAALALGVFATLFRRKIPWFSRLAG